MFEEERDHLSAIERWSAEVAPMAIGRASDIWELPAEIARALDQAVGERRAHAL